MRLKPYILQILQLFSGSEKKNESYAKIIPRSTSELYTDRLRVSVLSVRHQDVPPSANDIQDGVRGQEARQARMSSSHAAPRARRRVLLLLLVHLALYSHVLQAGRRWNVIGSQISVPLAAGLQGGRQVPAALAAPRRRPSHPVRQGEGDLRGGHEER